MTSASKSRRSNRVALQSLQSRTSISIEPVSGAFSAGVCETADGKSRREQRRMEQHTRCDTQRHCIRAPSLWVAANNSPASSAMMPSKRIAGKLLLAEWTPRHAGIILPADDTLFQSLPLISLA